MVEPSVMAAHWLDQYSGPPSHSLHRASEKQEAQLPQRNSASAAHVLLSTQDGSNRSCNAQNTAESQYNSTIV